MLIALILAVFLFSLSLALNFYQRKIIKTLRVEPAPTYEARQLIHDMTNGAALVKITRVAPEDVLLRSPRDLSR